MVLMYLAEFCILPFEGTRRPFTRRPLVKVTYWRKKKLVVHFRVTTSECISIEMKLEVVIDCRVFGCKQS